MNPEQPDDLPFDDERLLTVPQAARILLVSPRTVYRLIRRGELSSLRVGRHTRLRAAELRAFIRGTQWFTLRLADEEAEPD